MKASLAEGCRIQGRTDLIAQWDRTKNAGIDMRGVSASDRSVKIWWSDRFGHTWQQTAYDRLQKNRGCPVCAGRVIQAGFNDLATTHPQLATQWDAEKNGDLTPEQLSAGSHQKIWWRCEKGHSWQAAVSSRASGCGCPVCANRVVVPGVNDLATTHPQLAAQWHPTKNGDLTPQMVTYGHDRKVWWMCRKGHEWQASPHTRVRMGSGCPVCANDVVLAGYNDLRTQYPVIAAEWHPEKNGNFTPEQVVSGSSRSAWWQCALGHEWRAKIVDRTRSTNGCPYCANKKVLAGFNDLASLEPELAAQWHPELNGSLTPDQVTAGSARKVWWQCPEGHTWRTAVCNRTNQYKRTGCPVCAGTVSRKRHCPEPALPFAGELRGL